MINNNEFDEMIKKYEKESDKEFWLVERKDNKEAVAINVNRIKEDSCEYDDMKCKPESLKDRTYPYYGLIFTMNQYYLEEKKLKYEMLELAGKLFAEKMYFAKLCYSPKEKSVVDNDTCQEIVGTIVDEILKRYQITKK